MLYLSIKLTSLLCTSFSNILLKLESREMGRYLFMQIIESFLWIGITLASLKWSGTQPAKLSLVVVFPCFPFIYMHNCLPPYLIRVFYAREGRHHPESYRVLKALYQRHIEGKHVPFQRCVITPEEREEIENDRKLPSYSRGVVQYAPRSKCIVMLNNIRNPKCSCLF